MPEELAKHHFLALMREPFADKVPNLIALLTYLNRAGCSVDLVLPEDGRYPAPSGIGKGGRVIHPDGFVRVAGLRMRVPMTAALALSALQLRRSGQRPEAVIGAGSFGLIAAFLVSLFTRLPLVCFSVELPQTPRIPSSHRITDAVERVCYRRAALVITHDLPRQQFLVNEIRVPAGRVVVLPNGTLQQKTRPTPPRLQNELHLPAETKPVLHIGGFGPWFESHELAQAALSWPEPWRLVFHTSHRVEEDPYFQAAKATCNGSRVSFATTPLGHSELDQFVCGASIGLAWYSLQVLGFRGELMGMASGKIGQYLKCGLPVVCNDIATIRCFLDKYNCGVCVSSLDQLPSAFERIWSDYGTYSRNATRCYRELWEMERHCAHVAERLEDVSARSCLTRHNGRNRGH